MKTRDLAVASFVMGLASTSMPACNDSGGQGGQTGQVQVALAAATSNGTYRLRAGTFRITGPSQVSASTEDDLEARAITVALAAGEYLVALESGWFLERQPAGGGTFAPVTAQLTSQNPLPITIRGQATTNARFQFAAGDALIDLGSGELTVGIDVNDSHPVGGASGGGAGGSSPGGSSAGGAPAGDAMSSALTCRGGVVISQVFTTGGNANGAYLNDFIELHNAGDQAASLAGWSVQYASATGAAWAVTALPAVVVPPGGFVLVQEASGGGAGAPLPLADGLGTINLSATGGKVALVATTTALSGPCPTGAPLVDLLGYGTVACFEGSGPAAAPTAVGAVVRLGSGCADTNQNATDTTPGDPVPRNALTAAQTCSCTGS